MSPAPPLHRPAVRRVALAVATALAGVALGAGGALAAERRPGDAGSTGRSAARPTGGPLGSLAAPAPGSTVRGTVERVAVEGREQQPSGPAAGPPDGSGERPAVLTFVRTARGRVPVHAADLAPVRTGSVVEVRVGGAGGPRVRGLRVVRAAAAPGAGTASSAAATPAPHQVTVALVVPPGGTRDATTVQDLSSTINGEVSRFWSQATAGQVSFRVTKAAGWIDTDAPCSDAFGLWSEVKRRTGFVDGPGRHLVVYLTPVGTADCYYGLGTIGAGPASGGDVFVRAGRASILAHELGHNLGLGHSDELQCPLVADGVWSAGRWTPACREASYRDWYDVMGVSWDHLGSLSTAHAWTLGTLPANQVTTVSAPGSVALAPVSAASGLRSMRVVDPDGATYVVEYRAARGRDGWLAQNWAGLRPGVVVRRTDPAGGGQTLLLDATPSGPGGWDTDLDVPLAAGGTLTTASGRVQLRVEETTAHSAVVSVAVDGVAAVPLTDRSPRTPRTPRSTVTPSTDPGGRVPRIPHVPRSY